MTPLAVLLGYLAFVTVLTVHRHSYRAMGC
jgi:hypothetical protein